MFSLKNYIGFMLIFTIIFTFFALITMNVNIRTVKEEFTELNQSSVDNLSFRSYALGEDILPEQETYCVVGDDINDSVLANITFMLDASKKPYWLVNQISHLSQEQVANLTGIIYTTPSVSPQETEQINNLLKMGIPVLFAVLPDEVSLQNPELCNTLGIMSYGQTLSQTGIHIVEGVLIGGRMIGEEIEAKSRSVELHPTCKTYIRYDDPESDSNSENALKNEHQNSLLWRTYYEGTIVQVFNNNLLESAEGYGIFMNSLAQMQDLFIYPVINSFAVSAKNFPMGNNYDDDAMRLFGRDTQGSLRDIVWPDFLLLSKATDIRYTFFTEDSQPSELWLAEMRKRDFKIFQHDGELFIVTARGFNNPGQSNLLSRSLITAFGLINHKLDMGDIYLKEDDWRDLYKPFSTQISVLSKDYPWISKDTLDIFKDKLDRYITLTPEYKLDGNDLSISCNQPDISFIIRTKPRVVLHNPESATITQIEDGCYLLKMQENQAFVKIN